MAQVVDVDVTRLTLEWTTNKENFCNDRTPIFHFLGYRWYIECSVSDRDMYRITLQNQISNERIEDGFYVTTFLKVNNTPYHLHVTNVQNPRSTLWMFYGRAIEFVDFLGLGFAEFTVVCQFVEKLAPLGQEIYGGTSSPFAHSISSQRSSGRTSTDFDLFDYYIPVSSSSSVRCPPKAAGSTSTDSDQTDFDQPVSSCSSFRSPPKGKLPVDKSVQTSLEIPQALESLSIDFCNLLKNEDMPDVRLKCGERTFPAHRAVLAARSEVFAAMFRHKMAESESGIADVTDIDEHVLEIFLKYIYTGRTSTPTDDVLPKLYVAANKYAVNTLKRACSEWMIGSLTTENCLDILKLADTHSDQYLEAAVMNFVVGDMELLNSEAWGQIEKEHPMLALTVYRAVLKCQGVLTSK